MTGRPGSVARAQAAGRDLDEVPPGGDLPDMAARTRPDVAVVRGRTNGSARQPNRSVPTTGPVSTQIQPFRTAYATAWVRLRIWRRQVSDWSTALIVRSEYESFAATSRVE